MVIIQFRTSINTFTEKYEKESVLQHNVIPVCEESKQYFNILGAFFPHRNGVIKGGWTLQILGHKF